MDSIRRATAARAIWEVVRGASRPGRPGLGPRLQAFPRMLRQGMSGAYPYLDTRRLGLAVLALCYLVSPVDIVPELFLSVLGLGDDALVAAWLAGAVLSETEAFLGWEHRDDGVVDGELPC